MPNDQLEVQSKVDWINSRWCSSLRNKHFHCWNNQHDQINCTEFSSPVISLSLHWRGPFSQAAVAMTLNVDSIP